MAKRVIKVGGMSCEHCTKSVAEALEALCGVSNVNVDLSAGTAAIDLDESECGEDGVRAAIEDIGFDYLGT